MRHTEYGYLDEQDHVYLDYTGSGLAARAQHRAHAQRQAELVLGNPHSVSPTSELATDLVEKTRARVLQHFNASPDEYAVVFTPNATGAARLIGEAYQFAGTCSPSSSSLSFLSSSSSSSLKTKKKGHKPKQRLILTADNHNSLNGLREYARRQGVSTTYVQSAMPDLHISEQALLNALGPEMPVAAGTKLRSAAEPASKAKAKQNARTAKAGGAWRQFLSGVFCGLFDASDDLSDGDEEQDANNEKSGGRAGNADAADVAQLPHHTDHDHAHDRGLFAYPAQSNFSGVRHPLRWIAEAQRHGYDVLLDAAAYLPTSALDLQEHHPDFVLVSWYKLFGFPTGVGCLVARREALARLDRPWFSGGTIRAVSVGLDWHAPAHRVEARFEDGTVNFQAIPDVYTGLEWLASSSDTDKESGSIGGMQAVGTRVRCLTGWFLDRLVVLRHSNGQPMARLYGPDHCLPDGSNRGGTVTFNFLDPQGQIVDERIVASEAAAARISLRTGCFCNPGAGETALGFSRAELRVLQALATNSKPTRAHHTIPPLSLPTPTIDSKMTLKEDSNKNGHGRSSSSSSNESLVSAKADSAKDLTRSESVGAEAEASAAGSTTSASTDDASEKQVTKSTSSASLASSTSSAASSAATTTARSTTTDTGTASDNDWPIAGAVRVSFGVASNTADVDRFFAFARRAFRDRAADNTGLGPRVEC
ncbi:hypothetical protein SCUCBS95973_007223 [Sporothrix curviconia]|uniref:Aminotransferase class V domain-containing protein n=1 Tax=Sporothrix curviconia TaxID=1260050 RepID=A0ABP0CBK0_9PEZI